MKFILPIAAVVAFSGVAVAQQLIPLPLSADPSLTPGAMPTAVSGFGARATTACDDFNRAALGGDWTPLGGTPTIILDGFADAAGANCYAQQTTASVNYDSSVIVLDLPDLPSHGTYGAAVHGLGGGANLYTKVQSGGGGQYANIGFYTGFNTGSGYAGAGFFGLSPAINGGTVTFYFTNAGDTINVDIDEDRDGNVDFTYSASGVNGISGSFGTGVGVGSWGGFQSAPAFGSVDSFELNGGCGPVGPAMTVSAGAPGGSMTFDFANFSPSGLIAIVYGPAGSFTVLGGPCAGLAIDVLPLNFPPVSGLITLFADGAGTAQLTQNVPAAGAGLSVQAADVASCVTAPAIVL